MVLNNFFVVALFFGTSVVMCSGPNKTTSPILVNKLIMSSNNLELDHVQGEVIVQSPPLVVKGPPKGFPLIRQRREIPNHNTKNSTTIVKHGNNPDVNIKKKPRKNKRKGGLMKKIGPYMFVPAMIAIGFAPLLLAQLKMMVMSAFMINVMALNAAIFLTLRNMVFGPRSGEHIKYYNFGYSNKRHTHSPHIRVHE